MEAASGLVRHVSAAKSRICAITRFATLLSVGIPIKTNSFLSRIDVKGAFVPQCLLYHIGTMFLFSFPRCDGYAITPCRAATNSQK
jgi:hypothetical protein